MSRSGYSDECENYAMYRGQVAASIRGRRGQALLTELAEAMDAMPEKILIANSLKADGGYCALGVVGAKRGIELEKLDPEEPKDVGAAFNISWQLAAEIVYMNDEAGYRDETPEARWTRVRAWAADQIRAAA